MFYLTDGPSFIRLYYYSEWNPVSGHNAITNISLPHQNLPAKVNHHSPTTSPDLQIKQQWLGASMLSSVILPWNMANCTFSLFWVFPVAYDCEMV